MMLKLGIWVAIAVFLMTASAASPLTRYNKGIIRRDIPRVWWHFAAGQSTETLAGLLRRTGRTYSDFFSEPSLLGLLGIASPCSSWMGADHADDLQYVFGKPFTTPLEYSPSDRCISEYMISYWTNFAKTGDPNKGDSDMPSTWSAFSRNGPQFLEIHSDMDKNYVKQQMRLHYVHFWTSILPSLPIVVSE